MSIHKNDIGAYNNAKNFVEKFFFEEKNNLVSINNGYLLQLLDQIRHDISRFNILEELNIEQKEFNTRFDKMSTHTLKAQKKYQK